jgi:hypothetical protein
MSSRLASQPDVSRHAAADLPVIFDAMGIDALSWKDRAEYAYAFCRIHAHTAAYIWARCLLRYGKNAARAFRAKPLQDELRARVARLCGEALQGEDSGLVNFTVRDGRLAHAQTYAPHTSFSRERGAHWETVPERKELPPLSVAFAKWRAKNANR